ncbi:S8 family serine peptidase [Georgenia sp. TF02-10]|uniref:S8 family serine peptidase n=1 Tax=Georgenia sp. TF02-10 TaxID=2917725 RepID=UPI001FA79C5B|nr:S8 family serine peptidase [Georgenia sp. TF02-10]UNX55129.1 S8 family serine peptidase [Georgenia sp. TF02-10]
MHVRKMLAGAGVGALLATAAVTGPAGAAPAGDTESQEWLVLSEEGAAVDAVVEELAAAGATVESVNDAIGLVRVTAADDAFAEKARDLDGVAGVATNRIIGSVPERAAQPDAVERENLLTPPTAAPQPRAKRGADPLDDRLWGMDMIDADKAHRVERGDDQVTVGVLDTGVQADHPDLTANVDAARSRNFVTDIPAIDGPCEDPSCVDPATEDDGGHGTHVAGTIAASLDGFGLSGVAPDVTLVNIRGGQDSGYFFLGPVTDALTYAADTGIDVVNMSFYVDPWLYNCIGGAPEDPLEAAADQAVVIEAMTRSLNYAHDHGVTLVAALGNDFDNLSAPRVDTSSPDYDDPANDWDNAPYPRTIDNSTCFNLPTEGPHVIGVSAVGPSERKADYSNWVTDLRSGEIEVAAPGGWFRDGFGTPSYMTNENLILSTVPLVSLQDTGEVDEKGDITPIGESTGVIKQCTDAGVCGYYAWYQGTSMAAPHASGVAALVVSNAGRREADRSRGLTMDPDAVRDVIMFTARNHPCPRGGVQSYEQEGRGPEWTATCTGSSRFNGFYGDGIVNAHRAAQVPGIFANWGR